MSYQLVTATIEVRFVVEGDEAVFHDDMNQDHELGRLLTGKPSVWCHRMVGEPKIASVAGSLGGFDEVPPLRVEEE